MARFFPGKCGFIFVSATLAACQAQAPAAETPGEMLIGEARAAVTARLKDPGSVEFADLRMSAKPGVVCGTVNAKNSYGGYGGPSAFWYDRSTREAFVYDAAQNWEGKAADAGIFAKKGCTIGAEQARAIEAGKALAR